MTNPTNNVFTVKPLEWEEIATGIKAKTIFGDCHVECFDRTGAQWWLSNPGGKLTEGPSLEDGKAKAEAWYFSRLLPALEPVKGEARGGDAGVVGRMLDAVQLVRTYCAEGVARYLAYCDQYGKEPVPGYDDDLKKIDAALALAADAGNAREKREVGNG